MKLTVIGCSGSFPGPDSPASSYLVQADDEAGRTWNVLLDLGSGAFGPLQRVLSPFALDAVALTHLHPDHFIDMCGLYVFRKYHPEQGYALTGNLPPLQVLGPAATADRVAQACDIAADEDISAIFAVSELRHHNAYRVGPLTITPFRVQHPIEAYALRVTGPGQQPGTEVTLTFSGDTDSCPGLVKAARNADALLVEASFVEGRDTVRGVHLTGQRAGQVATEAAAKRVLLTHIPSWTPHDVVLAEARGSYAGPLENVQQGAVYDL